jgi:hypothetical protein
VPDAPQGTSLARSFHSMFIKVITTTDNISGTLRGCRYTACMQQTFKHLNELSARNILAKQCFKHTHNQLNHTEKHCTFDARKVASCKKSTPANPRTSSRPHRLCLCVRGRPLTCPASPEVTATAAGRAPCSIPSTELRGDTCIWHKTISHSWS